MITIMCNFSLPKKTYAGIVHIILVFIFVMNLGYLVASLFSFSLFFFVLKTFCF